MRNIMVAGNWKMFGSRLLTQSLLNDIVVGAKTLPEVEIVVFPSTIFLPEAATLLQNSPVSFGAQNIYPGLNGAFTGETATAMLTEFGCRYVLVGHSERRILFGESLPLVAAKFQAVLAAGLTPVLCVGETLAQREADTMAEVLQSQLATIVEAVGIATLARAVIAYEPVWAIGTGKSASPAEAQQAHAWIRAWLGVRDANVAKATRILYGGSVKADNAAGLMQMPDIDGALVGGASLDAKSFLAICHAMRNSDK